MPVDYASEQLTTPLLARAQKTKEIGHPMKPSKPATALAPLMIFASLSLAAHSADARVSRVPEPGELQGSFTCRNYGTVSDGSDATAVVYSYKPGCEAGIPSCTHTQIKASLIFDRAIQDESGSRSTEEVTRSTWLGYQEHSVERTGSGHRFTFRVNPSGPADPSSPFYGKNQNVSSNKPRTLIEAQVSYDPTKLESPAVSLSIPGFNPGNTWDCDFDARFLLPSAVTNPQAGSAFTPERYASIGMALHKHSNFSMIARLMYDLSKSTLISSKESIEDSPWMDDLVRVARVALGKTAFMREKVEFFLLMQGILRAPLSTKAVTSLLDYMAASGYAHKVVNELQAELREQPNSRHPLSQLVGKYCAQAKIMSPYADCEPTK